MNIKRLQKGEGIQLGCSQMKVGLQWDIFEGQKEVDLDASCVTFDEFGRLLDAAFYNQKETEDKSIVHSGDCKDGKIEGDDEYILIDFTKINAKVKAIIIVLNAYQGGDFSSVETATANISDTYMKEPIVSMSLSRKGKHTGLSQIHLLSKGLIMCTIFRDDKNFWHIKNIDRVCDGKNFQSVEFEMKEELYFLIPPEIMAEVRYDPSSKKSFNMKKDQVINIPTGTYTVGLGWDTTCDLDASCAILSEDSQYFEFIYYGAKISKDAAVKHKGDNRTGEGTGDDENIQVNLNKLNPAYSRVLFVVTIYSPGYSFSNVKGAYIRMMDSKNKEMFRYKLSGSYSQNGMIMSSLFKESNQWKFKAIGESAKGHTIYDLKSLILDGKIKKTDPRTKNKDPQVAIDKLAKEIEAYKKQNNCSIKAFAKNCDKKDLLSLSDPYYILTINTSSGPKKYQSEYIDNTLDPNWKNGVISFNNEYDADCHVDVYDYNSVMKHSFIGECDFKVRDVYGKSGITPVKFSLINSKKKSNTHAGDFYIAITADDHTATVKESELEKLNEKKKVYEAEVNEFDAAPYLQFYKV